MAPHHRRQTLMFLKIGFKKNIIILWLNIIATLPYTVGLVS